MVLIDENNQNLGVLSAYEAKNMAQERGYDLVEVNPKANPPVCKLLDYGAYMYQLDKQERKAKAKQKKTEVKGIRLSFKIGQHDRAVRLKNAQKFLGQGHKVRIEMLLRGREMAHKDIGLEIINNFVKELGEKVEVEQPISRQGRNYFIIVYKKS